MCIVLYFSRDGEWKNRREETVVEAQNACEEFCHGSHGRDGDGYGAPDSVCGTTLR